jgi:hypothetical protein
MPGHLEAGASLVTLTSLWATTEPRENYIYTVLSKMKKKKKSM